jgi:signal transduction histidine kinase
MRTATDVTAVNTRLVFIVYAVVAWVAGAFFYAWGRGLFVFPLAGWPQGSEYLIVRLAGSVLLGVGFLSYAMSQTLDDAGRRSALGWWAVGHAVVGVAVLLQLWAFVGLRNLGWGQSLVLGWLAAGSFLFSELRWDADGIPWGGLQKHDSLLEDLRTPGAPGLRSAYEEKIREAASQEERHRLARDLHDSIKQQIFVMHTAAATAQARFDTDPDGARAAIEQVRGSAREAMTEMEAMLDQLRAAPLENTGLVESLKKQCEALRFRTGADVQLSVGELPPSETLPVGSQQVILRVAQEALANVGRHARATRVSVTLDSTPISVQLRVDDDGVGFDQKQPPSGMGLGNMRTRAQAVGGVIHVTSEPGKGALVRLSVPHAPLESVDPRLCLRRALSWTSLTLVIAAQAAWIFSREHDRLFLLFNAALLLMLSSQSARITAAYLRARKISARERAKAGAQ